MIPSLEGYPTGGVVRIVSVIVQYNKQPTTSLDSYQSNPALLAQDLIDNCLNQPWQKCYSGIINLIKNGRNL